jgi:acetyl esterase/lipase
MQILFIVLSSLAALASITLFMRLRWPAPAFWILKLYTSALSMLLALTGLVSIAVGLTTGSLFIVVIGSYDFLAFSMHIFRVTRPTDFASSFEHALGLRLRKVSAKQKNGLLPILKSVKAVTVPRLAQDIAFTSVGDTGRELLCDVWQPNENVTPSGVSFIYLHGGAWYLLDKDLGTRPLFKMLAARGHVIMDVAYRLPPEADMMGMVHDVKRAIVWMKKNARSYGVNPDRIIVGGGSAGAHLALLSAYTSSNPMFTPRELEGEDMNVNGVISLYGPSDLAAMYYHTNQHLTTRSTSGRPGKAAPTQMPTWIIKKMGKNYHRLGFDKGFESGDFAALIGGHPGECPKTYELFSPVTHVHSACPPTLLIHGEDDVMAPINSTRLLNNRLTEKGVPTVMHIIPQTDHAFDLILPRMSPSAHNAFLDVDRFLTMMSLNKNHKNKASGSRRDLVT